MSSSLPPYYMLVSHAPVATDQSAPLSAYTTFSHPTVEYHYADDLPHALLPRSPGEHVLVLDYDPQRGLSPVAQSLSTDIAMVGVKVTEAPGAGTVDEVGPRNNKMYVLEATTMPEELPEEEEEASAQAILTRFKHCNSVLRTVLDYPQGVIQVTSPTLLSESPPKT